VIYLCAALGEQAKSDITKSAVKKWLSYSSLAQLVRASDC
jgi:hypothetical protein